MNVFIHVMFTLVNAACLNCQFKVPPQIISQFQSEYYITEGNKEARIFRCRASGQPTPKYEWMKDGVKVVTSQRVEVNETLGTLSIIDARLKPVSDFGTYQCFATNELGIAVTAAFEVKIGCIRQFKDKQPIELITNAYTYLTIQCAGKPKCEPHQDCKIEWKRGTGATISIKESKRIAVDTNGDLHFLYTEESDESTPTAPIACGMNHESVKTFYKGRNVTLRVTPVTNPKQFKPFPVFALNVKGLLGGEATLQCVFAGYPLPYIEWYKPDGSLIIADWIKYSYQDDLIRRNLIIRHLDDIDEGTYRCDAKSIAGKGSAHVFLNVTSKPMFFSREGRLENKVVPIDHDVKFMCKLESLKSERRPTTPEWTKNGVRLPESQIGPYATQKFQLNDDHTELTIKALTRNDTCSIMCESGNVIFDDNFNDKFVKTYAGATLRIIAVFYHEKNQDSHSRAENNPRTLSGYPFWIIILIGGIVLVMVTFVSALIFHFYSIRMTKCSVKKNQAACKGLVDNGSREMSRGNIEHSVEIRDVLKDNELTPKRLVARSATWLSCASRRHLNEIVDVLNDNESSTKRLISNTCSASDPKGVSKINLEAITNVSNKNETISKIHHNYVMLGGTVDTNDISERLYENIDTIHVEEYTSPYTAVPRKYQTILKEYKNSGMLDAKMGTSDTAEKAYEKINNTQNNLPYTAVSREYQTIPKEKQTFGMLEVKIEVSDTSDKLYENTDKTQIEGYTSPYTAMLREYQTIPKTFHNSIMLGSNMETNDTSENVYENIDKTQVEVYTSPYTAMSREYQTIQKETQNSGMEEANM